MCPNSELNNVWNMVFLLAVLSHRCLLRCHGYIQLSHFMWHSFNSASRPSKERDNRDLDTKSLLACQFQTSSPFIDQSRATFTSNKPWAAVNGLAKTLDTFTQQQQHKWSDWSTECLGHWWVHDKCPLSLSLLLLKTTLKPTIHTFFSF